MRMAGSRFKHLYTLDSEKNLASSEQLQQDFVVGKAAENGSDSGAEIFIFTKVRWIC